MAAPIPRATATPKVPWTPLLILTGAAFVLRALRLEWQPLWWDEGYSVYFATEPFARMLELTAHDIHPPLYYALLQLWMRLFGSGPAAVRLLSAVLGAAAIPAFAWVAGLFFPSRRGLMWVAVALLAINPAHLYYSQEVRMYSLALLLSLLATGAFWRLVDRLQGAPDRTASLPWGPVVWYTLVATLALYSLYYTALLLLAHGVWALVVLRRRVWPVLIAAWGATVLLYAPWLIYALPRLVGYVAMKVDADQDLPLGPLEYLLRHITLFVVGHVGPATSMMATAHLVAIAGAFVAALLLLVAAGRRSRARMDGSPEPVRALAALLLIPAAAAFVLNLRLPFFPAGGERLLLMLLPYWLLLLAAGATFLWQRSRALAGVALGVLALASALGITLFYTVPRYANEDYRPLLRQVVQQAAPDDTFVALFPWMVGYWRAYTPASMDATTGAAPLLLSNQSLTFGPPIEQALADGLARGALWFPEPLALGSSLPLQMENWLGENARNLENRWFSPAVRLTAWAPLANAELPAPTPSGADFGALRLQAAAAAATAVAGGPPVPVTLVWEAPHADDDLVITLRLLDGEGRTWAARDLAAAPGADGAGPQTNELALHVPVGTPPGTYRLFAGVGQGAEDEATQLLPVQNAAEGTLLAPLGSVQVVLPATAPALERLPGAPLRTVASRPLQIVSVTLPEHAIVAGSSFNADLYAVSQVASPPLAELSIALQQRRGAGSAGWASGALAFPTAAWPQGYPVRLPVDFYVPADLPSGLYDVVASWVDPAGGTATGAVDLGAVSIAQRSRSYVQPAGGVELVPLPTLGTHARLRSYTLARDGGTLMLGLTWEALQPLLPPHHIFVHADAEDASGGARTLAQADGPPLTAEGAAPTGSWLAGEYLTTQHTLTLPAGAAEAGAITLRVGLYEPQTLVRLPVSLNGQPAGDAVDITTITAN